MQPAPQMRKDLTMKNLAISTAALALLSAMALSSAQAAPVYQAGESQATPIYRLVDCMARDGDANGCWRVGPDYGPYSSPLSFDQTHQRTASDRLNGYHSFFNNSGGSNADALYRGTSR
jgi:hypothetical protein